MGESAYRSGGAVECGGVAVWRCGGVACGIVGVRRERFDPTFQTRGWLDLSRRYGLGSQGVLGMKTSKGLKGC
jgi:hypothetical protein